MAARYSASYTSDPRNVTIARKAVATFARSCGFSAEVIAEIELAAGEALANAAEHGAGKTGGSFQVRCDFDEANLTVEVRDSGRGFPPDATLRTPDLERTLPTRGFGLTIMRALSDSLSFSANGTVVRITRRLAVPLSNGNGSHPH